MTGPGRAVHLRRPPTRNGWLVVMDGVLIGRVRQTDGQWNASYWARCGPSRMARESVSLGGTWNRRTEAVQGVVGAWLEDNP